MQKTVHLKVLFAFIGVLIFLNLTGAAPPAHGAFLYKSYIVRQDRGRDILCDPYVVKKDDYVLKLLRQKGEIAHEDFPEFLAIFKRINPHIRDINRIRPNQQIFIPLKKLRPGAMPGQSSGIVTIPFVTISTPEEIRSLHSKAYKVQKGDCVSILISRQYGAFGTKSYMEGIKLFKMANPNIPDINRIFMGQRIFIPKPSIRNQPWYPALLDGQSPGFPPYPSSFSAGPVVSDPAAEGATAATDDAGTVSPLSEVADALGAKLLSSGTYYFPRADREDLTLDLDQFPVMKYRDRTIMFADENNDLDPSERNVVEGFWQNSKLVSMSSDATKEQLLESVLQSDESATAAARVSFQDNGVTVEVRARWITPPPGETAEGSDRTCITLIDDWKEKTPNAIRKYLAQHRIVIKELLRTNEAVPRKSKDHLASPMQDMQIIRRSDLQRFVDEFAGAIGCRYTPNVGVTFPYAGIQVQAVSNLISTGKGRELLVDFGDLYGDAIESIKKTGFNIIQVTDGKSPAQVITDLLESLDITYESDPVFTAANRTGPFNTTLTIPGFLVENPENLKILFTPYPLHDRIVQFLQDNRIKTVRIEPA
jgi:hypothetical protein